MNEHEHVGRACSPPSTDANSSTRCSKKGLLTALYGREFIDKVAVEGTFRARDKDAAHKRPKGMRYAAAGLPVCVGARSECRELRGRRHEHGRC